MWSSGPWLVQCRLSFVFDLLIHGQLSPFGDMATEDILIRLLSFCKVNYQS
jgi:hypothetical protein